MAFRDSFNFGRFLSGQAREENINGRTSPAKLVSLGQTFPEAASDVSCHPIMLKEAGESPYSVTEEQAPGEKLALTLPSAYYASEKFFGMEKRAIFSQVNIHSTLLHISLIHRPGTVLLTVHGFKIQELTLHLQLEHVQSS